MNTALLAGLLEQAESELSSIRAQRAEFDREERLATERVAHLRALIELDTNARDAAERPIAAAPAPASDMRAEDIAAEILTELGPMHYRELWEAVGQRGGVIVSGNPAAVLLTRISRDDRFKRAKGRGVYALALASRSAPASPTQKRRRRKTRRRVAKSASQAAEE